VTQSPDYDARLGRAVSSIQDRAPWVGRLPGLDAFRGLAIACMFVDHIVLLFSGPELLRLFPGRLAMPAFFLLAGHLVTRVSWRTIAVGALGFLLPMGVPWVDSPNVLTLWAVGVVLICAARRLGLPEWPLILLGLAMAANGYTTTGANAYEATALVGLMALGAMLPASTFLWAGDLPARLVHPLAAVGRAPIRWYVGHLLALQFLALAILES
jgi:hypothetical protein